MPLFHGCACSLDQGQKQRAGVPTPHECPPPGASLQLAARTNASVLTPARARRPRDSRQDAGATKALVGGGAEDFADFAGEALQGEGLLQESFLAVDGGGAGEGVLGVAGEVEDFQAGARGLELLD